MLPSFNKLTTISPLPDGVIGDERAADDCAVVSPESPATSRKFVVRVFLTAMQTISNGFPIAVDSPVIIIVPAAELDTAHCPTHA